MKRLDVKNVRYEFVKSDVEGCKEVRAFFNYNGKDQSYFMYIKEDENTDYIKQAEKQFKEDLKSGAVAKALKIRVGITAPWLIITTCVLAAATIALSGVLIYKSVSGGPGTPIVYLNNPTKITQYQDGSLASVTAIKYDEQWGVIERTINSYDESGSEIEATTIEKYKYDEKHRRIEGESTTTYTGSDEVIKNVFKTTIETDYKGNEYTANYENGELINYSYDEYERTFTDIDERYVNDGIDVAYYPGTEQKQYEKTRHGENYTNKSGTMATSLSTAIAKRYEEDGTLYNEQHLYNETRQVFDEEKLRNNIWRFVKTETVGGETEIETLIGFEQLNENKLPILTEIKYYTDEQSTILDSGTKTVVYYDNLNRPVTNLKYKLVVPEETTNDSFDTWIITESSNLTYYKDSKKVLDRYVEHYEDGVTVDTISTHNKYDEYARVIYDESTSIDRRGRIRKTSSDYEYGDPVPVDPETEEDII